MKRVLIFLATLPFRVALAFYLWLWDEGAPHEPRADIHRKIIWELREAIRRLQSSVN